ncbi:MAG: hypothetical protein Q4E07_00635 [Eubacteriales bacterium]|nr:hypothetical protein [Eubacteriales bacterium]
MKTLKRLNIILLALLMPLSAFAQNVQSVLPDSTALPVLHEDKPAFIEYIEEESGNVKLSYVQIKGLKDPTAEQKINLAIQQSINIESYLAMGKLEQGSGTIIKSRAYILNSDGTPAVISVLVSIEGRLMSGRIGHEYIPLMFSAFTGEIVNAANLFNSSAQEKIDTWLEEELINMSYYDISQALPVPLNRALLSETGLIISYPQDSFKFLSDRSAAFSFYYYELKDVLNLNGESLIAKLDVITHDNAEKDLKQLHLGLLPNVPDILGKPIQEVLDNYKELTDSERYIAADRYVLEAPEFRSIYPIVNDGQENVSGILAKRMAIAGCKTGVSSKEDIIKIFGEPLAILPLDGFVSEQYFVPEGEGLMYAFDGFSLMITMDKQNTFTALLLQKEE